MNRWHFLVSIMTQKELENILIAIENKKLFSYPKGKSYYIEFLNRTLEELQKEINAKYGKIKLGRNKRVV